MYYTAAGSAVELGALTHSLSLSLSLLFYPGITYVWYYGTKSTNQNRYIYLV